MQIIDIAVQGYCNINASELKKITKYEEFRGSGTTSRRYWCFQTVINGFYENNMILNTGKCHYMCMGKDVNENETLQTSSQEKMINSKEVETLGIKID